MMRICSSSGSSSSRSASRSSSISSASLRRRCGGSAAMRSATSAACIWRSSATSARSGFEPKSVATSLHGAIRRARRRDSGPWPPRATDTAKYEAVSRSSSIATSMIDVGADLAAEHVADDQLLARALPEREHVDGAAAHPHAGRVDRADPGRVHEDAAALHRRHEPEHPGRAGPGRDEHHVLEPARAACRPPRPAAGAPAGTRRWARAAPLDDTAVDHWAPARPSTGPSSP